MDGLPELERLLNSLQNFMDVGYEKSVDDAASNIAKDLRDKIANGKGADGSPLAPLKQSTLDGPIRVEGNPQIRKTAGSIPMNASGKTAASIKAFREGKDWEVGSDSPLGDKILLSNAKSVHHGNAFGGDTPKPIRDPVQVTERQMDLLEDEVIKGIERAANG